MRRALFIFAALLSLTACGAAMAMWVRSYGVGADEFGASWQARNQARSAEIYFADGSVGLAFIHVIDHRPNYNGEPDTFADGSTFFAEHPKGRPYLPSAPGGIGGLGFWLHVGDDRPGWRFQNNIRLAEVPLWFVILAAAPLPAFAFIRKFRRGAGPGFCAKCGYDLRASPDRCPECGQMAPRAIKGRA